MGYIEDAKRLINHVKQIKQTGASATQEQANPPADIGIFADGYPEWVQDDGGTYATRLMQRILPEKCLLPLTYAIQKRKEDEHGT